MVMSSFLFGYKRFAAAFHAARHETGGLDELDLSGLSGRTEYVDRGDPASSDWDETSLVMDYAWHVLDCSAIVPAGATSIMFAVLAKHANPDKPIYLRKNGNSNIMNVTETISQAAGVWIYRQSLVFCDADRKIEYLAATPNWTNIDFTICGWMI